jgi:hypothetical protein
MKKFPFLIGVALGYYFRDTIADLLKQAKTKVDQALDEDAKDPEEPMTGSDVPPAFTDTP